MLIDVRFTPQKRTWEVFQPKALNNRDQKWSLKWGPPREDIQNARMIIGQGRLIQHLIRATRRKSAA